MRRLVAAIERADRLADAGASFSALVELAAVFGSLHKMHGPERERIRGEVEERVLRLAEVEELIKTSARERAARLERILASGGNLLFEEIVLVLTVRIELALADRALRDLAGIALTLDSTDIDRQIEEVATRPDTGGAYRAAVAAINKNWLGRVPFDPVWLGVDRFLTAT